MGAVLSLARSRRIRRNHMSRVMIWIILHVRLKFVSGM